MYEWRPGTARHWQHRLDEYVGLAIGVAYTSVLMAFSLLQQALIVVVLYAVMQTRQPHFVDLGRFSAGIWPEPRRGGSTSFLAIGWGIDGGGRAPHRSGLWITLGGVTVGAFALMTRDEWAQWTAYKAQGSPYAPENFERFLKDGDQ
ncbi:hypothetical protein ABTY59_32115 [Streptomyces sp. NPDC096079]|uniref:hypothetical protein n=1 Tax=Streptomyces sp. NPDC096079 TaxID=3155820 RepID=UPI00332C888F